MTSTNLSFEKLPKELTPADCVYCGSDEVDIQYQNSDSNPFFGESDPVARVTCKKCNCYGPMSTDKNGLKAIQKAVVFWNTRSQVQ